MQRFEKNKKFETLNRQLKTRPNTKDLLKARIIPDKNQKQRRKSAEIAIQQTLPKQIYASYKSKVKNALKVYFSHKTQLIN